MLPTWFHTSYVGELIFLPHHVEPNASNSGAWVASDPMLLLVFKLGCSTSLIDWKEVWPEEKEIGNLFVTFAKSLTQVGEVLFGGK